MENRYKRGREQCARTTQYTVLRRQFGRQIIETIDLRAVRSLSFADADAIGRKIVALHEANEELTDTVNRLIGRYRDAARRRN